MARRMGRDLCLAKLPANFHAAGGGCFFRGPADTADYQQSRPETRSSRFLRISDLAVRLCFEAVGDRQLQQFKKNPDNKGHIIQSGLWRYTRHPNYFGEATLWWGIFLIAFSVPYGLLAIVSPVLIDFLLLKVSGIPMLEVKYEGNAEFEAYKKRTNAFFPWFPKSGQLND